MVDPMHNNDKYLMELSDQLLVGARIRFSKNGWLLLSRGKKIIFFYDPFTRETIRLPDLPYGYTLGGISFSSLPTSPDYSSNCFTLLLVIAISNWNPGNGEESYINFLVTGPGKSATGWTTRQFMYESTSESRCESTGDYLHEFMPCINNPVYHKGDFYCLDYNGLLGVFSVTGYFSWKVLSKSLKQFSGFYPSYLVECDDKLLLVNVGQSGNSVNICRLDDSEMAWNQKSNSGSAFNSLSKILLKGGDTQCTNKVLLSVGNLTQSRDSISICQAQL
ncbi:F-box/kelch-repeat protein At1g57790-like [Papaver somniferum]|uniref:F-box/kelch-repeat protein At1g57790-like n=1 Tax=Papaver somniferum TaxID=3469 RepID=UPI000E6F5C86|nr:F-box/kelch-repeat protein At1g57790-like [Papaver somniferum]